MGFEFGNLVRMWHVTYSSLPWNILLYYFSKGIPNVLRHPHVCTLHVGLPLVVFYLIYTWGNQEFEQSKRRNLAMYGNDECTAHIWMNFLPLKDSSPGEREVNNVVS